MWDDVQLEFVQIVHAGVRDASDEINIDALAGSKSYNFAPYGAAPGHEARPRCGSRESENERHVRVAGIGAVANTGTDWNADAAVGVEVVDDGDVVGECELEIGTFLGEPLGHDASALASTGWELRTRINGASNRKS
mmetsp:Transcript_664/g.2078  ORF Transcript_664/g.2078 Transcript_664/m.2078 type:complete len:137 (+) Transcript_664:330-740(+)